MICHKSHIKIIRAHKSHLKLFRDLEHSEKIRILFSDSLTSTPDAPQNLTLTVGDNVINASVDAYSGASAYNWYLDAVLITSTGTPNYQFSGLTNEQQYDVFATATVGGIETKATPIQQATPVDVVAPAAPTGLNATFIGGTMITIAWDSNAEADLEGYNVYVDGVKHNGALLPPGSEADHDITGLSEEVEYDIYVTAVDDDANESDPSNTITETTIDATAPDPPSNVTLDSEGDTQCTVSADPSASADVDYYNAYRDDGGGATKDNAANLTAGELSGYVFDELVNGTTYDFWFTAVDDAGNESAASTKVQGTPASSEVEARNINSLSFDGVNDYVDVGTLPEINLNLFTITAWFKTERTTDQVIFGTLNTGNVTALTIDLNTDENNVGETNNLRVFLRDDDENRLTFALQTPYDFTDGQWHHLAVVRDSATTAKIFLDGVEQTVVYNDQQNASNFSPFEFPMTFGALNNRSTIQNYFEGSIDEIQFYDSALTRADIVSNMNKILAGDETDLVGYWNSEDRSRALDFDGSNDYVNMPTEVSTGDTFSVSCIIRVDGAPAATQAICGQGFLANRTGFGLFIRTDLSIGFQVREGGTQYSPSSAINAITPGKAHVITGVRDNVTDESRLYIDGVLVDTVTGALSPSPATEPFSIGARMSGGSPGFFFNGIVANVQVWNRELTAVEIADFGKARLEGYENGLVGYWPFWRDSGSEAEDFALNYDGTINGAARKLFVKDLTANNNYGNVFGATYAYDGFDFDYSLAFDGVDDWIDLDAVADNFPQGSSQRTIEGWFHAEATVGQRYLEHGLQANLGERISITATGSSVAVATGGHNYGVEGLSLSGWNHFAVVFPSGATQSDEFLIYINGVIQSSSTLVGSVQTVNTTGQSLRIGTDRNESNFYDGKADEIRFWSVARTADQIRRNINKELTGNETGLVAYWKFDDMSDLSVAKDSAGSNNGVINGAKYSAAIQSFYQGLSFDGVDDYVDVGTAIDLSGGALTVEAWIRPDSIDTQRILRKAVLWNDNGEVDLYLRSDGGVSFVIITGGTNYEHLQAGINYEAGKWIHITGTYDGSQMRLFRNGRQVASVAKTGSIQSGTASFLIGAETTAGLNVCTGALDEARVWSTARTQTEIRESMTVRLQGNETGLIGYWPADEAVGASVYDRSPNGNDGAISGAVFTENVGVKP